MCPGRQTKRPHSGGHLSHRQGAPEPVGLCAASLEEVSPTPAEQYIDRYPHQMSGGQPCHLHGMCDPTDTRCLDAEPVLLEVKDQHCCAWHVADDQPPDPDTIGGR